VWKILVGNLNRELGIDLRVTLSNTSLRNKVNVD
jgi:hypothetical protein